MIWVGWAYISLESVFDSLSMPPRRQLSTPGAWPNPGLTERRCTHARSGETSASELFRRPTAARAVPRHWQSHRATGPQSHRATGPQGHRAPPGSGRPRFTSRHDDRFLRISTRPERMITSATTLRRRLMNAVHVNVSASTIGSRLRQAGLHPRSAAVRRPWTPAHCHARTA